MRSRIRVTVLMAVYDPDPIYFPEAVRSILDQTFEDFELLVIEDPSKREAGDDLARIKDPRIRHIRNPVRTNFIDQKNLGLREARGNLVAMMDADDVAEPERLGRQVHFMRSRPEVTVLGSQIAIIDKESRVRGFRAFPTEHDDLLKAMSKEVPISHPSVMVRKRELLDAGGYQFRDFPAAEDYELWSRMAREGARFANLHEPLLRYRIHSNQWKYTRLRETIRAILHIKKMYWAGKMDLSARLRVWVERSMLALPRPLVMRLFAATQYQSQLPMSAKPEQSSEIYERIVEALAVAELEERVPVLTS